MIWRSFEVSIQPRSGSKKQLMLSVAGIEQPKLDALCKEAAAKEAPLTLSSFELSLQEEVAIPHHFEDI